MRMTSVTITNYRALRNVTIPLSHFGCLIGENNAGKSSILQALSLFFSGSKLSSMNFFDASQPIRIEIVFEDVGEADLARLVDDHRVRVSGIINDGRLALVRLYDTEGKSVLKYRTLMPAEERFSPNNITSLLKGGRAGRPFAAKVAEVFPELDGVVDAGMNQDAMREKIQEVADAMPDDQKEAVDLPLPTGIDKSIVPMLPAPIYIPAVKDLADDIKTTESTPFGKILAILLRVVESKLPDAQQMFEELNSQLNIVKNDDGTFTDDRLDEVKEIEATVETFVRDSFADVSLRIEIPPPELKTIFSSARLSVDDGVDGLLDTKGDGLRRAVVFAILRSYVHLNETLIQSDGTDSGGREQAATSYLLLFEEPELFLHPKAQNILFDALRIFANDHDVLVTTHSPMFFGASATETFVKLNKSMDPAITAKPFTQALPVDLSEVTAMDQFRIICFENNNAAFFADSVVLVEGDSDYLLFPHIARTLNPSWDVARLPIHFARISGKGNIRRYREFFRRFDVRVAVIADLDILLDGFQHVPNPESVRDLREQLIEAVDRLVEPEGDDAEVRSREAKKAHASGELRGLWKQVKARTAAFSEGQCTQEDLDAAMEEFVGWQRKPDRLSVLMECDDSDLLRLKWDLLEELRRQDVYVLERGAIESYYPSTVTGPDKPSRAQSFCDAVNTRDAVLNCCGTQDVTRNGEQVHEPEFISIFEGIFSANAR